MWRGGTTILIKRKDKYYVYDENRWIVIITRIKKIAERLDKKVNND